MKTIIKTNKNFTRKVRIDKFCGKYEIIPMIINPIINDWVIYGSNPILTFNTIKEVNDFVKKHLSI